MKIRNYLTIFFAILAILALIALAGFMTVYVADDSNLLKQQILRILPLTSETDTDTPASDTESLQTETAAVPAHTFVFAGDSRTIGMGNAVGDNCIYIGAEGEGYTWFSSTGTSSLATELESNPAQDVIINFGVNDPENINLYIDLYTSLIEQYPDTSFYFLSVNPLIDGEGFNTTNEMISLFNTTLESFFPNQFLDSNTYLTESGFETVDGLHYTTETYRKIHNFVVEQLI